MPELPEVETMVRDLRGRILGRTIMAVDAPFAGSIVWPSIQEFRDRACGQKITSLRRRGKFALFTLESGDLLILHRGMTGTVLLRAASDPLESHVRVLLVLDDGSELRFNDPRKFGKIYLLDEHGADRTMPWSHFGPEPLNGDFTTSSLGESLRGRTGRIKPLLLNQTLVAGLGNIYVDEALFQAAIHPTRPANTLTPGEINRLHAAVRSVLESAIERRGTTFSSYTDIEGRTGRYQDSLQVFHRVGEPCPICSTAIVRLVVGGRGTHVCPSCQQD